MVLAAAVLFAGCGETAVAPDTASTPPVTAPAPAGLVVSEASGAGTLNHSASGADLLRISVAYVSLPSGTVPGGLTAVIRNVATDMAVEVSMIHGGLDPVPLPASVDDEIEVVATDTAGGLTEMRARVPSRRTPVVVRTSPPRGRTDVPLNSVIIIVFSEPIALPSASDVQLLLAGAPVPIALQLAQNGVQLETRTQLPLQPGSQYELRLSPAIQDLAGEPIGTAFSLPFESGEASIHSIEISPASGAWRGGEVVQLSAAVRDVTGELVESESILWTSLDPHVAIVNERSGAVRSVGAGEARVQAAVAGITAVAVLNFRNVAYTSVSAGAAYTCATSLDGAYCWGDNSFQQVTTGGTEPRRHPVLVGELGAVSAGGGLSCGLGAFDRIRCWGRAMSFNIVLAPREWNLAAVRIVTGEPAFACAVEPSGHLSCWGRIDENNGRYWEVSGPSRVAGGAAYAAAAVGRDFFCGLRQDGSIACTGRNELGQLGVGDFSWREMWFETIEEQAQNDALFRSHAVQPAPELYGAVTAGATHACALTVAGAAWCWGDNTTGQLGVGSASCAPFGGVCPRSAQPLAVTGGLRFRSIAAGSGFTCGATVAGELYCWGRNSRGQLGRAAGADVRLPARVATSLSGFLNVAAGGNHACATREADLSPRLFCWGANDLGQLGSGTTIGSHTPQPVALQ